MADVILIEGNIYVKCMKHNMRLINMYKKKHRDGRFSGAFIMLKYQNIHV